MLIRKVDSSKSLKVEFNMIYLWLASREKRLMKYLSLHTLKKYLGNRTLKLAKRETKLELNGGQPYED
jgi:hypothetical protein